MLQQRPSTGGGQRASSGAWFLSETGSRPRSTTGITSWDMKMKTNETGDYVVGQMWARTGKDCWLMDQLRGQWDRPTTVAAVCLMAVRFPQRAATSSRTPAMARR
jgi:phage terminase large subunit-like protein